MTVRHFLDDWLGGPFRFMDRYSVMRRIALAISLWITVDSYVWAKHFAETSGTESLQIPAIIAAVLASVTGLQGWVFKLYLENK